MKLIAKKTGGVAVAILFAAAAAEAVPTLRISANGGANWYRIRDVDGDGNISFDGSIGGWTVSLDAIGRPQVGSTTFPILDLSSSSISSSASGTLLIEFSDVLYGPIPDGNYFKTSLESVNIGSGRTTVWTHSGAANTYFDRASLLGLIGETGDSALTTVSSDSFAEAEPFSLTMRIAVRHSGADVSTFSARLVDPPAVPDAGTTLGFLGVAIGALSIVGWRRSK